MWSEKIASLASVPFGLFATLCSLCSPSRFAPALGLVIPSTFATAHSLRFRTHTLIRDNTEDCFASLAMTGKQAHNGVKIAN